MQPKIALRIRDSVTGERDSVTGVRNRGVFWLEHLRASSGSENFKIELSVARNPPIHIVSLPGNGQ